MDLFEKESRLIVILILFSATLFLIGLGRMPLTDPDEAFYAETVKEMLNRREFLTPYIFGKPQFEKPPLYYWLVILGFKAFGVNEFASRVGSAVFGILGVVGVYLLGKILLNKKAGFFAGFVLATNIQYLVLSRACVTDMVLAVLILYAFLFFFYGHLYGPPSEPPRFVSTNRGGSEGWYLLSSVFLGLAVLTKGPIGLFLPAVTIGIYLILTGELKKLKEIPFLRGILLFLVVSLPWYFLMYKVHGKEFIDVFFGFHNIIRFLQPEHKTGDVFYYYVPLIIGGFFPWIAFLPLGIWQVLREKDRLKKANIFLIVWFLVVFIFFSLSRTKLPTYIFPLYPALALLVGRIWDIFLDKGLTERQEKGMNPVRNFISNGMNISLYLFLALSIGGTVGAYIVAKTKYPTCANGVFITGIAFILLMSFFVATLLKKRHLRGFIIYSASFIIFVFLLSFFILPEIGKYESSKHISEKLLGFIKSGEEIGAETRYRRGVAFYTDREDIVDVHPHDVLIKFLSKTERVWCILKEKNHIQLYTNKIKPYDKPTYVVYKFGKKVIVTNNMPADGKFIKMRTKDDPY